MRLFRLFLIPLSLFFAFSCSNKQIVAQLSDIHSIIEDYPDSALVILESIPEDHLHISAIKARYSLLYAMALDKNYIDTTDVRIIEPAVKYYEKHGAADEKMKAYYYQGRIYENAGDINSAAISFSIAESYALEATDNQMTGLLYMALANIYNKTRNKDKEEEYVMKGICAFDEAGDVKHGIFSAGRLAILYYGKQEWDKADSLFRTGIEQAEDDTVAMSVFLSNYARLKVVRPNPDPQGAIDLLKRLSSYGHPLSLIDYGVWAYAASLTGDEQTCTQIENQLKRLDEPQKSTILNWLFRIEQLRGNYEIALDYYIGANAYNAQFIDNLLSDTIGQTLQSYYSSEALSSKREAHILRLRLSLVVLGLCLFFLLSYSHLKHKKDKYENEVNRLLIIGEESNKLLRQTNEALIGKVSILKSTAGELEMTLEDLRKKYVSTYKDKFSAIGELCNVYLDSNNRTDKKDYIVKRVEKLIAYISDDDKLHTQFENQINKDLNNIVKHLKADLGNVDKRESRFICYCIVGFDPEMIGSILNLSISNVYTKKSRLKEKIRGMDSPYKDEYLRML